MPQGDRLYGAGVQESAEIVQIHTFQESVPDRCRRYELIFLGVAFGDGTDYTDGLSRFGYTESNLVKHIDKIRRGHHKPWFKIEYKGYDRRLVFDIDAFFEQVARAPLAFAALDTTSIPALPRSPPPLSAPFPAPLPAASLCCLSLPRSLPRSLLTWRVRLYRARSLLRKTGVRKQSVKTSSVTEFNMELLKMVWYILYFGGFCSQQAPAGPDVFDTNVHILGEATSAENAVFGKHRHGRYRFLDSAPVCADTIPCTPYQFFGPSHGASIGAAPAPASAPEPAPASVP